MGRILAQRVAGDPTRDQAATFEDAVQRDADGENRRLGVLGEAKFFVVGLETKLGDRHRQAGISLLEDFPRFPKSVVNDLPHSGVLGALARVQEGDPGCSLQI
jgi:hypothetical protein